MILNYVISALFARLVDRTSCCGSDDDRIRPYGTSPRSPRRAERGRSEEQGKILGEEHCGVRTATLSVKFMHLLGRSEVAQAEEAPAVSCTPTKGSRLGFSQDQPCPPSLRDRWIGSELRSRRDKYLSVLKQVIVSAQYGVKMPLCRCSRVDEQRTAHPTMSLISAVLDFLYSLLG